MSNYFLNHAEALGSNKAMMNLIKLGKVTSTEEERKAFEYGIKVGEAEVARGIEEERMTRLEAMQAEKRGADIVVREFAK